LLGFAATPYSDMICPKYSICAFPKEHFFISTTNLCSLKVSKTYFTCSLWLSCPC